MNLVRSLHVAAWLQLAPDQHNRRPHHHQAADLLGVHPPGIHSAELAQVLPLQL